MRPNPCFVHSVPPSNPGSPGQRFLETTTKNLPWTGRNLCSSSLSSTIPSLRLTLHPTNSLTNSSTDSGIMLSACLALPVPFWLTPLSSIYFFLTAETGRQSTEFELMDGLRNLNSVGFLVFLKDLRYFQDTICSSHYLVNIKAKIILLLWKIYKFSLTIASPPFFLPSLLQA